MTTPYKACPRCGTPATLDAPHCAKCGRTYRTQFGPADQTQAFGGFPPGYLDPPWRKWGSWASLTLGMCALLYSLATGAYNWNTLILAVCVLLLYSQLAKG